MWCLCNILYHFCNSCLIMPGISYNRSRQAGGAMPHSADRLALRVEVSDEAWGSDASFVRLRGRAGWIGSWSVDQRWLVRLDGGFVGLLETRCRNVGNVVGQLMADIAIFIDRSHRVKG